MNTTTVSPTTSGWGVTVSPADAPFHDAYTAAIQTRCLIQDEIREQRRKLNALGKKLRAATLVEDKARRVFKATPSGQEDERRFRHYMAERYGPKHLLPEERAAFVTANPQWAKPAAA